MTPEQLKKAAAVMLAAAEGKPIEFTCKTWTHNTWAPDNLGWNWVEFDYRIAVTKPSINWKHVHPDFKWMAIDQNGKTFLHTTHPHINKGYWVSDLYTPAASYASFIPGTCDWTESLVVRPGVE